MTIIEGLVRKVENWSNGRGADVWLVEDNDKKYYYEGNLRIPFGVACSFEIKEGEGDRAKSFEILSAKPLVTNPEMPKPPQPVLGTKMIQLPWDEFNNLVSNKSALQQSKTRALDAAVKVYDAMNKVERDPIAAAQDVVKIAIQLEGYLV